MVAKSRRVPRCRLCRDGDRGGAVVRISLPEKRIHNNQGKFVYRCRNPDLKFHQCTGVTSIHCQLVQVLSPRWPRMESPGSSGYRRLAYRHKPVKKHPAKYFGRQLLISKCRIFGSCRLNSLGGYLVLVILLRAINVIISNSCNLPILLLLRGKSFQLVSTSLLTFLNI